MKILRIVELIYKAVVWIVVNGIPFFRGLIEEWKAGAAKRAARK